MASDCGKKRLRLLAEQDANRRSLEDSKRVQAQAEEAVQAATARLTDLDSADDELARSVGAGDIVASIYRVATAVPESAGKSTRSPARSMSTFARKPES